MNPTPKPQKGFTWSLTVGKIMAFMAIVLGLGLLLYILLGFRFPECCSMRTLSRKPYALYRPNGPPVALASAITGLLLRDLYKVTIMGMYNRY